MDDNLENVLFPLVWLLLSASRNCVIDIIIVIGARDLATVQILDGLSLAIIHIRLTSGPS